MNVARILVFGVMLAGLTTTGGCLLLLGGGVAAAYVMGDEEQVINGTPEQIVDATKAVVEEMELALLSANATKLDGSVTARNNEGKKLQIDVKAVNDDASKVSIRKGFFGDGDTQKLLMEKIKAKVKG